MESNQQQETKVAKHWLSGWRFWVLLSVTVSVILLIAKAVTDFQKKKEQELQFQQQKAAELERLTKKAELDRQAEIDRKNDEIVKSNFIKAYEEQAKKDAEAAKAKAAETAKTATTPATTPAKTPASTPAPTAASTPAAAPVVITSAVEEATKTTPKKPSTAVNDGLVLVGGMLVNELITQYIVTAATKAGRKQAAKLAYKASSVGLRAAAKVFAKLGLSSAGKLAAFGLKAGTKAAQIAGQQAVEEALKAAGKQAVKAGAKQAAKTAFYAVPGVGQALMAFDILSAGLDMGDGGGYGKMGTIATYTEMKETAAKELKKAYDDLGIIQPTFKGPDIDYEAVGNELQLRFKTPEKYPQVKAMTDSMEAKIREDLKNNVIKPEDLEKEDILAKYTSIIDPVKIQRQIIREMCESKNGKVVEMVDPMSRYEAVEKSKQNGKLISKFPKKSAAFCEIECQKANCKSFVHRQPVSEEDEADNCWLYSDSTAPVPQADTTLYNKIKEIPDNMDICTLNKAACESSFSWPLKENEEYAEFKSVKLNANVSDKIVQKSEDLCVSSDSLLRTVCDSNNIPYDQTTGICKIDEKYCKMKGAEWVKDPTTGIFDCAVDPGQGFAEAIFGTTIVRGLKQVFDLSQYEKCQSNEVDDGYFCRNTDSCDPVKQEACLGLCYPKCDKGYHPVGCNICSPDCPPSSGTTVITDDGATCRTQKCKAGEEKSGELCYPTCKAGFTGVGPVCWEKCPAGWNDYGVGCNKYPPKDACPGNMRDDGTSCWLDTYGNGVGTIPNKRACPAGMRDDGTSCWLDTYGRGTGYANWFESWDEQLKRCEKGEGTKCEWNGAIAYPVCRPGYKSVGCCLCEPERGPGIYQTLFDRQYCGPGETNVAGLCYKNCKPGYHYVGGNLCEPDGGPGIKKTIFDRTKCDNANARNVLGLCDLTKSSYGRTAGTIPETTIAGKGPAIGRGVGTPAVTIRPKERIVPYSTKQNALQMNFGPQPPETFEVIVPDKYFGVH